MNKVPDSVLICSKNFGDQAPKGVYANTQLDTFFETKVVQLKHQRQVSSPYIKDKKLKRWEKYPLKRKIFSAYDPYIDREQADDAEN